MKRILLAAMLAAILMPVVAEAGPLQRVKQRGGKVLAEGKAAIGVVVGRLGCG
jgi:hypothetical protein